MCHSFYSEISVYYVAGGKVKILFFWKTLRIVIERFLIEFTIDLKIEAFFLQFNFTIYYNLQWYPETWCIYDFVFFFFFLI